MNRQFDDNLYQFDRAQPSYWEATAGAIDSAAPPLEHDESCDVAIFGGGYTGLSAALHLAREFYQFQVEAIELVREIGDDRQIDFLSQGDAEVEVAHTPKVFAPDR